MHVPVSLILSQYSDIMLAILVIGVVSMMIVPLPTPILDVLLAMNISGAILIMLVALYISSPLKLATFPSILLISTLFRLALNVSSTRLILLQADAGEVIRSFGEFVVQGNMIVGGVIFIILTLINFIVISKGSERVAEVSARFTLDAMPGKQMSIDAELRTGTIDQDEARAKRRDIERESQLFGAMDGAMKFVKGDAIAGIVITIVNIFGGILIGTLTKGIPVALALKKYGILTIGDGLVTQIPALIIATSAGLVVTRVSPQQDDAHLGRELSMQLLAHPKAFGITSCMLILLGIVPGLPLIPFWILAALMFITSKVASNSIDIAGVRSVQTLKTNHSKQDRDESQSHIALPVPISINLSSDLSLPLTENPEGMVQFEIALSGVRDRIHGELGIHVPRVMVRLHDSSLKSSQYRVFLYESLSELGDVPRMKCIVRQSPDKLGFFGNDIVEALEPGGVIRCALVPIESITHIRELGLSVLNEMEIVECHIENFIRRNASELLGLQETKWLCEELEHYYPDTVREVIPRCLSYTRLRDILYRLLREGVSIRDLKRIIETLAEHAADERDNSILTEKVRAGLQRQILAKILNGQPNLNAFLIDSRIETLVHDSLQTVNGNRILAIDPTDLDHLMRSFNIALHRFKSLQPLVILTMNASIRHVFWKLLSLDFPNLIVLSIDEISQGIRIVPIRKIQLN